ncbi:MAG: nucleotidyltransferase domain-containing protein [Pirellulaceae bacterium]
MVPMEVIEKLAERVAREFAPERIILFGSYASGSPTADSDVDLLVLVGHTGKSWREATRIRNVLKPGFPLDLLVRSPEELECRLSQGDPFFREIVEHGKVLYEADRT